MYGLWTRVGRLEIVFVVEYGYTNHAVGSPLWQIGRLHFRRQLPFPLISSVLKPYLHLKTIKKYLENNVTMCMLYVTMFKKKNPKKSLVSLKQCSLILRKKLFQLPNFLTTWKIISIWNIKRVPTLSPSYSDLALDTADCQHTCISSACPVPWLYLPDRHWDSRAHSALLPPLLRSPNPAVA